MCRQVSRAGVLGLLVVVAVGLLAAGPVGAQTVVYTWRTSPVGWTWDTATLDWQTGAGNVLWVNSTTASQALFSNAVSNTLTVSSSMSANAITFASGATGWNLSGGGLTLGSGGITAHETATVKTPITLSGTQTWTVDPTKTLTMGAVAGSSGWLVTGGGTLTLTAASTYSGGASIQGGTVALNAPGTKPFGTGTVTVQNNGLLDVIASGGTLNNVNVQTGGILAAGTNSYTMLLSNGSSLTVASGGTIAANLGTGNTTLSVSAYSTNTANVTLASGAVFDVNATSSGDSMLYVKGTNAGLTLADASTSPHYYLNIVNGSAATGSENFVQVANSSLLLDNLTSANWTVNGGNPSYNYTVLNPGDPGGTAGKIFLSITQSLFSTWSGAGTGGNLGLWSTAGGSGNWNGADYADTNKVLFDNTPGTDQSITIGSGGVKPYSIVFGNTSAVSYSFSGGPIAGSTSLAITGGGTVSLNQANTYSGGTSVSSGTLKIGIAGSTQSPSISVGNSGILNVSGSILGGTQLADSGSVNLLSGGSIDASLGSVASGGVLNVGGSWSGSGSLTTAGSVNVASGGTVNVPAGSVASGGVLNVSGSWSGSGSLTTAGAVNVASGGTVNVPSLSVASGGALNVTGSLAGTPTLADSGTVTCPASRKRWAR